MSIDNKELLERAIVKIKEKRNPALKNNSSSVFVPTEAYREIYDSLEVWDNNREDKDVQDKTRYIYDSLKEQGQPRDLLLRIYSELGATPRGEKKIERVYRYLKLKEQANKYLNSYEAVNREINAFSNNR